MAEEFFDSSKAERQLNNGMPASRSGRTKALARKKIRVVKITSATKSVRRNSTFTAVKSAPQRSSVRKMKSTSRGKIRVLTDVPGWNDLIKENNRRLSVDKDRPSFFGAISTLRFTLGVLAMACIFTLYVGHVYATQSLLSEVQAERKENLSLRLQYNRKKGVYDAATGPAVIYKRAQALGLEERMISGPTIRIAKR
ncbi:MAG: hypothetical protein IH853_00760 [Bacteroidetes bacterium]|nr:hypothetical protein [Bacteroidota bacterium]